jgi:hypothetical protein
MNKNLLLLLLLDQRELKLDGAIGHLAEPP